MRPHLLAAVASLALLHSTQLCFAQTAPQSSPQSSPQSLTGAGGLDGAAAESSVLKNYPIAAPAKAAAPAPAGQTAQRSESGRVGTLSPDEERRAARARARAMAAERPAGKDAAPQSETARAETAHTEAARAESARAEPAHVQPARAPVRVEATRTEAAHAAPTHAQDHAADHRRPARVEAARADAARVEAARAQAARSYAARAQAARVEAARSTRSAMPVAKVLPPARPQTSVATSLPADHVPADRTSRTRIAERKRVAYTAIVHPAPLRLRARYADRPIADDVARAPRVGDMVPSRVQLGPVPPYGRMAGPVAGPMAGPYGRNLVAYDRGYAYAPPRPRFYPAPPGGWYPPPPPSYGYPIPRYGY